MRVFKHLILAALLALGAGQAAAIIEFEEGPAWAESSVSLPLPPQESSLQGFLVSALATNRFFVDTNSVSVGDDGVVRFTLVIQAPSGVRNVSYEGMRCSTGERRAYAYGAADGTWSPARQSDWQRIRSTLINRHYAALFSEYFCIPGAEVRTASAAVEALRHGGVRTNY